MPRFRLRFLLQEFDLVGPEIVIGRSPECHITIEDPLISRKHARVAIRGDEAYVADLGSRNGVRVNGRLIKDREQKLREGDRLRIGTQELVFSAQRTEQRTARPTGYMRVCHACGTPFPEGTPECPHCGALVVADEDTVSGVMVDSRRSWTFQLLGEVIERALTSGKSVDAERLMRRAAKEVDDQLATGERLDPNHISMIAQFGVRLSALSSASEWVAWVLTLHRRQGLMLGEEVIEQLEELDLAKMPDAVTFIEQYLEWYRSQNGEYPAGLGGDGVGRATVEELTEPSPDRGRANRLELLLRH